MKARRRPVLMVDLYDLPYWQLCQMAEAGSITWSDVAGIVERHVLERNGGDPYGHLRPFTAEELR